MMAKHVDLIAVGLLLLGMAAATQVRRAVALECNLPHRISITSHRDGSIIVIPPAPPRSPLPFTRD